MGLNDTPSAERVHIGFFGRRNAGKSSLVNAVTGQELSVVSPVKGTTTDPVYKSMELLPLGPVVIMDTPGSDDEGELGELRVKKTAETLGRTDCAVLVVDGERGMTDREWELVRMFQERKIPFLVAWNKADLANKAGDGPKAESLASDPRLGGTPVLGVSAVTGAGIRELKEKIAETALKDREGRENKGLLGGLLTQGQTAVLVIPIDESAPKGRINRYTYSPGYSGFRGLRHNHQGYGAGRADGETDPHFQPAGSGDHGQSGLREGERSGSQRGAPHLIFHSHGPLQGISHRCGPGGRSHPEAERWGPGADFRGLHPSPPVQRHRHSENSPPAEKDYGKGSGDFHFLRPGISGGFKPLPPGDPLRRLYAQRAEVEFRRDRAKAQGVPFTNYGIALAGMNGILGRSIEMFPELKGISQEF